LARHLKSLGARRVGVVFDRSPIGRRYHSFLLTEAEVLGLQVAASVSIAPLAEEAEAETGVVLDVGVDALVYLGLGLAAPAVAQAATARKWEGPRCMNTAGMRGYSAEFAATIDGWAYVDMHSDDNTTLADFRRRMNLTVESGSGPAYGFDMGRLVAEGLARAPERTRDGVKEGLEQVKWLPAAEGYEGTTLSFGHFDRGALHGRYLVLRQWKDGSSVEL
jgi:branched-chain amino acid transport system substrate-binding protein